MADRPEGSPPTDAELFAAYGADLAEAVVDGLPQWIRHVTLRFVEPDDELDVELGRAAEQAVQDIGPKLRDLLALGIDEQWTNPLSIVRTAVTYPTEILAGRGVAPVERDGQAKRFDPNDVYDLVPAKFGDFGPVAHDCGIRWGAAKAHLHLKRAKT